MAHVLRRNHESLSVNDWDWHYLLQMAMAHGWQPRGRANPDDLRVVTQRDAQILVLALEQALPQIPQEGPSEDDDRGLSNMPEDPREWFSGDGRIIVRHFIAFCRGGAFVVE